MHTLKWEPIGRSDCKYLLEKAEKSTAGGEDTQWGPWKPYNRVCILTNFSPQNAPVLSREHGLQAWLHFLIYYKYKDDFDCLSNSPCPIWSQRKIVNGYFCHRHISCAKSYLPADSTKVSCELHKARLSCVWCKTMFPSSVASKLNSQKG